MKDEVAPPVGRNKSSQFRHMKDDVFPLDQNLKS